MCYESGTQVAVRLGGASIYRLPSRLGRRANCRTVGTLSIQLDAAKLLKNG
jgi:hypothetical protein